ncbi:2-oxo acid dehydrogenase subunit E2 [Amycolatopsis sp. GM8]|uniref:2-oxo acid dehydrogenase subunit E2 n=1 Tax=Amycolatopsis sp. GM8 TaxID=2896530 RepID=UPI001F300BAF|nr:2-oxo acid dehydrogenase subunit E2 [Amycolatopsis sp. GM8]
MSEETFPVQRRHTLFFLEQIKDFAPVFLDTEVDMTAVVESRGRAKAAGEPRSVAGFVVHAAAGVLARHPDANSAIGGGPEPKVMRFGTISAKVTLDKVLDGRRVVLATVVPQLETASLTDIQKHIRHAAELDPDTAEEFAQVRALDALPFAEGGARFRDAASELALRPVLTGTFAVTSLGHSAVDGFHSVGGTTITLGVGRIADRPVVRDARIVSAPVMRLSLTFDHRVIDGAEAADVLTEIKAALEGFEE